MKKLVIQIPCFNEEATIIAALEDLPRSVPGFDSVEFIVIDDGCTDKTLEKALDWGVKHYVSFPENLGLSESFSAGIEKSLEIGADIIVNTDADMQYMGEDIPRLVEPVLNGTADIAIGDRGVSHVPHFSAFKRFLHRTGNIIVNLISGGNFRDVTSGFRAFSREAALRIHLSNETTFTIESAIQAHKLHLVLAQIPVETRPPVRHSRLIKSLSTYITSSAATLLRTTARYSPLRFFVPAGLVTLAAGSLLGLRFLYFHFSSGRTGHVQSLLLATLLFNLGFLIICIGLLADLIATNRRISDEALRRIRKLEHKREKKSPLF